MGIIRGLKMIDNVGFVSLVAHFQFAFKQPIFWLYVATVVVDIILGNARAWITGDVYSDVGIKGTVKHFAVFSFVVVLLPPLAYYLGTHAVSTAVITYLVYQYLISIIENLGLLGYKVPKVFKDNLRRLDDDYVDISKSTKVEIKKSDLPDCDEEEKQ